MSREAMQMALEALEEAHWKIEHKQDAVKRGKTITALHQALAEPEHYAAQNPLGGPAKVFDAMADAIRSGDDYHATLRRYGFAEVKALAEPEQIGNARCPRCWEPITAPTPRKPLSEQEMYAVEEEARKNFRLSQCGPRGQQITYWDGLTPWLIRAVEAAHGITGETK